MKIERVFVVGGGTMGRGIAGLSALSGIATSVYEADAKKLLAIGEAKANPKLEPEEIAAYTLVASMLLNLDETLTRN